MRTKWPGAGGGQQRPTPALHLPPSAEPPPLQKTPAWPAALWMACPVCRSSLSSAAPAPPTPSLKTLRAASPRSLTPTHLDEGPAFTRAAQGEAKPWPPCPGRASGSPPPATSIPMGPWMWGCPIKRRCPGLTGGGGGTERLKRTSRPSKQGGLLLVTRWGKPRPGKPGSRPPHQPCPSPAPGRGLTERQHPAPPQTQLSGSGRSRCTWRPRHPQAREPRGVPV